jgi:hypothetical protein
MSKEEKISDIKKAALLCDRLTGKTFGEPTDRADAALLIVGLLQEVAVLKQQMEDLHQGFEFTLNHLSTENAALKAQVEEVATTLTEDNAATRKAWQAEVAGLKLTCANAIENASMHLAAREGLEAEVAALKVDAERYRVAHGLTGGKDRWLDDRDEQRIDAAIDAAKEGE